MISKENNFDILRFIAAFQVIIGHGFYHLNIEGYDILLKIKSYFPGVLIFFTISGFLIYSSYERNHNLKKYFINRFLRIYPGLWMCLLITIGLLLFFGIIVISDFTSYPFISWIFAQSTMGQFYTPELLRGWGVGTPNGSLWTIPVEVEFYILLPLIVFLFSQVRISIKFWIIILGSMILGYLIRANNHTNLEKLVYYSCLPYLYCFLTGSLLYIYWTNVKKYLERKFLVWLGIFIIYCLACKTYPSYHPENILGFIANVLLGILTISGAFSCVWFSKILRGYDISYGMYIYHMLVINTLVQLGYEGKILYLGVTVIITITLSFLSWICIERKCLALKSKF